MLTKIATPCYGCPDRTVEPNNCHEICEKYLAYQRDTKAYRAKVQRARDHDHVPRSEADQKRWRQTLMRDKRK